jgi:hypothetical protein
MDPYGIALGGRRELVADRRVRVSGLELVIPGLRASPDRLPASPDPWDEEFDEPLAGRWTPLTATGTINSNDTVPSHLYMAVPGTATGANRMALIYRPEPPQPYTWIVKMTGFAMFLGGTLAQQALGIAIGANPPGRMTQLGPVQTTSGNFLRNTDWTYPNTFHGSSNSTVTSSGYAIQRPTWFRVSAVSGNYSWSFSWDGRLFIPVVTNPTNPNTPGALIIFVDAGTQSSPISAIFDYSRITRP